MKRKIRGVVAYSRTGEYVALGYSNGCASGGKVVDADVLAEAAGMLHDSGHDCVGHHFINAEIEIPDPVPVAEVPGVVEPNFLGARPGKAGV